MNLFLRLLHVVLFSRFRSRLGLFDTCTTPFRVWPTDLDVNVHMNNGVFLSIMDLARMDLVFRARLSGALRRNRIYPVVASQAIRYRRSLSPFAKFHVRTRLLGWDESFIFMQQEFVRGEETAALAVVKGVFLRKGGGRVPPAELVQLLGVEDPSPELPAWVAQWTESEDEAWAATAQKA